MKTTYYIAYGSNLDCQQMAYRCPTAEPIGKGLLHDYRLVFQGSPYGAHANVIPEEGQEVPVAIWEISPQDERALDRYEGVKAGYYTREFLPIEVNGETVEALIYIMTPHNHGIPADGYLATIARGYADFDLPIKYLNDAVLYSEDRTPYDKRMLGIAR